MKIRAVMLAVLTACSSAPIAHHTQPVIPASRRTAITHGTFVSPTRTCRPLPSLPAGSTGISGIVSLVSLEVSSMVDDATVDVIIEGRAPTGSVIVAKTTTSCGAFVVLVPAGNYVVDAHGGHGPNGPLPDGIVCNQVRVNVAAKTIHSIQVNCDARK